MPIRLSVEHYIAAHLHTVLGWPAPPQSNITDVLGFCVIIVLRESMNNHVINKYCIASCFYVHYVAEEVVHDLSMLSITK